MTIMRSAVISPCEKYRYLLTRRWDAGKRPLPFVMLNPSTADGQEDDATIRTCMQLARREGHDGIDVVNLFAWRATKPEDMKAAADPVGWSNQGWIDYVLGCALANDAPVVVAWGAHGAFRKAGEAFRAYAPMMGVRMVTLGFTAGGEPRHPLYTRADAPLIPA